MPATLDSQKLELIFASRPDILSEINQRADSVEQISLFNEIASHVYGQLYGDGNEPAHKRRKVDGGQANGGAGGASGPNVAEDQVLLEVKEISVSIPQRKKFELCFTQNYLYARAPGTNAPLTGIVYSWQDIEYAFYLPVPDKAQVQHNYILFPKGTSLPSKTNPPTIEPLVFTVPATAPKPGTIGGSESGPAAAVSDTYQSLMHWVISRRLASAGNSVDIVSGDPNKFHSAIRQPHRPNEKAVHVSGFRGSKDGYLFFLESGILWGYKKPLIFIPLDRIAAISYTSVLQITFNVVVEAFTGDDDANEEIEFGMLDQQDFGGIDAYIKFNRLQDGSMAEQRKAKLQLAENRVKKNADGGENGEPSADNNAAGDSGRTQLEQAHFEAEQELQDEEDEEEEDYDPGSEADSDGSGESDEEEDDEDDAAEGDEDEEVEEDYEEGEGGKGINEEEEAEGEDEEEEEEEESEEDEGVKVRIRIPSPRPGAPVAHRGWATISNPRPADKLDVDEDEFDVV